MVTRREEQSSRPLDISDGTYRIKSYYDNSLYLSYLQDTGVTARVVARQLDEINVSQKVRHSFL